MRREDKLITIVNVTEDDGTVGEAIDAIAEMIEEHKPKGAKKFTGGYMQRQVNKNILVLMYGYSESNNPISEKIEVEDAECDYIDYALKAYLAITSKRPKKRKLGVLERRKANKEKKDEEEW